MLPLVPATRCLPVNYQRRESPFSSDKVGFVGGSVPESVRFQDGFEMYRQGTAPRGRMQQWSQR